MNVGELEGWLRNGREQVVQLLGMPADWWPNSGHQSRASAWATAVFVNAALDRCAAPRLVVGCNSGPGQQLCKKVVDKLWVSGRARSHTSHEVLVDFSVHNWGGSNPVQITGESEMHGRHGVGPSMDGDDDYAWDFYKLLMIPSVTRLFMARVAGMGRASATARARKLARSLALLVDWYGPALLRPHDELGVIILPAAKKESAQTILMLLDRGRLRQERVSEPLLS